jgi:hypothetical protein
MLVEPASPAHKVFKVVPEYWDHKEQEVPKVLQVMLVEPASPAQPVPKDLLV